jgi:photosystem II stability/assembly factor-like uncharacterized protein
MGGHYGRLYRSFNSGDTWDSIRIDAYGGGGVQQILFSPTDTNRILNASVYPTRYFIYTTDYGKSWLPMKFPFKQISTDDTLAFGVNSESIVYAAILASDERNFAETWFCKSTDAGATWDTVFVFPNNPNRYFRTPCGLTQIGDSTFILGGTAGNILRTTDNGKSWLKVRDAPFPDLGMQKVPTIRFSKINPNIGYAALLNEWKARTGGLLKTTDAGLTWNYLAFKDTSIWAFELIERANTMELLVGGYSWKADSGSSFPLIARSQDGGDQWEYIPQTPPWVCNGNWSINNIKCNQSITDKPRYFLATKCGFLIYDPQSIAVAEAQPETSSDNNLFCYTAHEFIQKLKSTTTLKTVALHSYTGVQLLSEESELFFSKLQHTTLVPGVYHCSTTSQSGEYKNQLVLIY